MTCSFGFVTCASELTNIHLIHQRRRLSLSEGLPSYYPRLTTSSLMLINRRKPDPVSNLPLVGVQIYLQYTIVNPSGLFIQTGKSFLEFVLPLRWRLEKRELFAESQAAVAFIFPAESSPAEKAIHPVQILTSHRGDIRESLPGAGLFHNAVQ